MPTYTITHTATSAAVNGPFEAPSPQSAFDKAIAEGYLPWDASIWLYTITETSALPIFDQYTLWQAADAGGVPLPHPIEGTTYGTWSEALADLEACNPLEGRYLIRLSDSQRYFPETGAWGEGGLTTGKDPAADERR